MPKIPTFEPRQRITAQAPGVRTGLQVSPTATPAAALVRPTAQLAEYYERERMIAEKAEADKKYLEVSTDLDEIQTNAAKQFNPLEAQSTFERQSRFLINEKINQTQNKRIKNMLSDRFENDLIIRKNNVKKLSRQELDKQEEYNYNTEYELNLSKYKFGTESEKEFYKNQIFANQDSRSLYLNDSELTKKKSLDSINKDLFDVDFNNFIDNKNFGSALKMIKNFEQTKFLTNDQRSKYFDLLEKESQKSYKIENIKDALLNNRAWLFDSKDRNEGVSSLIATTSSRLISASNSPYLTLLSDAIYGLTSRITSNNIDVESTWISNKLKLCDTSISNDRINATIQLYFLIINFQIPHKTANILNNRQSRFSVCLFIEKFIINH